MLFGNDNAIEDKLLKDCYISHSVELEDKPILIGRWGTGKSAILLHSVEKMEQKLIELHGKDDRIWFIGEGTINKASLASIKRLSKCDESFGANLEMLWQAEITRRQCILLNKLAPYYDIPDGACWEHIKYLAKKETKLGAYWKRFPQMLESSPDTIVEALNEILHDKTLNDIIYCHLDIIKYKKDTIRPIVIMEPIDTPTSQIETGGMAQMMVSSLLNVYYLLMKYQEPFKWLKICIPWHRYDTNNLDYPQRFGEWRGIVKWDRENLFKFLNQRILWELQNVKRPIRQKDAWYNLFEESVIHRDMRPKVKEDSFNFFIRHTHYRPRELLRIARLAVKKQANKDNISIDELLLKGKVESKVMLDAVDDFSKNNTRDDFLSEISRMYGESYVLEIKSLLYGIAIPFTKDEIVKRYNRAFGTEISYEHLSELIQRLWECGIIGIEIGAESNFAPCDLTPILVDLDAQFGKNACGFYNSLGNSIMPKWYLFEYNLLRDPVDLLRTFENDAKIRIRLVLHPGLKNYFYATIDSPCPIGI